MRLSNRCRVQLFQFYNSTVLMTLVAGIVLFFIDHHRTGLLGDLRVLLIILPVMLMILVYVRGRQIFEYDSDGEALNFKNRNVLPFINHTVSDEFPKYKLLKYDVVNMRLFKKLYITISSKKGHPLLLKYDISYLKNKEIKDLKHSLAKVIRENEEINRRKADIK